jgi:hypothetical protein
VCKCSTCVFALASIEYLPMESFYVLSGQQELDLGQKALEGYSSLREEDLWGVIVVLG